VRHLGLGNRQDRPWSVGSFEITDWVGGGADDDVSSALVELDCQGGLGDVDGDGLPAMDTAEGHLLPVDGDDPGVRGPVQTVTGSLVGRGGGPGAEARRCGVFSGGPG